jgi:hypothetical protein
LKFIKNHEPQVITKSRICPPTLGFLFFSPKKTNHNSKLYSELWWHGDWRLIIHSLQRRPSFDCIKRLLFSYWSRVQLLLLFMCCYSLFIFLSLV